MDSMTWFIVGLIIEAAISVILVILAVRQVKPGKK